MNMNKQLKTICTLALLAAIPIATQAGLTLDHCQQMAQDNYPLLKKYEIIRQTTDYTITNINRGWLPKLAVSGQVSYQSAVATLPDVLAGMLQSNGYDVKGLDKDQYRLAIDANQTLWDGGNMKAQKQVAEMEGKVQSAQTDVDMYAIRERVNNLFFGILLIEDKIQLNNDLQKLLLSNCTKLENMILGGTAMKADVDVVKAEYLKTKQQMTELEHMKKSYQEMLAIFTNQKVEAITNLKQPEAYVPISNVNNRPELQLFANQTMRIESRKKLLDSSIRPRLSLFAQGWYGYTGYDMFNDMFDHDWTLNGIIGLRVSWNISNLYTHKNDSRKLEMDRNQVQTAQDVFLFNNSLLSAQQQTQIDQYRKMTEEDTDIINLRTSVRQAAESKLEHGIIDVNNLLQEITRENQARTDRSTHEVEMMKSIYELKNTINQ